ncbi:MAG TPA: hypothetical protein VG367_04855 [Mucilaginibacter sp.]|jgi:hypothetical protein|nr:hypothetical protein [Mucilaginibacter sp.]
MKKSIFLFLIVAAVSCSKKSGPNITPSTISLPNTTWHGFIEVSNADSLFQFAKFNGSTQITVGVGHSLTDPNGSFDTASCVIKPDPKDDLSELFIVTYSSGKVDTGFTLDYTQHIVFNGYTLSKVQ